MIVPPLCIIQLTDDQFASTMCSPPSTIPTKKVKRFKDIKDETFTYICFTEKAFMYYFFHFNIYWPVQNCATFLKCSIKISYFYHRTCKQTTFKLKSKTNDP